MKIAYIVSSPFSGSTLLSLLLNAHPQIATISEFDNIDLIAQNPEYLCSCGKLIRKCSFFEELTEMLNRQDIKFEIDDMVMMLLLHKNERVNWWLTQKLPRLQLTVLEDLRDKLVEFIPKYRKIKDRIYMRNEAFMRATLKLQGGTFFLDASKNPFRMKYLAKKHEVKAIYLYKNGIAGVYSFMKNPRSLLPVEEASKAWFSEQLTINRLLKSIPSSNQVHIPYTDLCISTEKTMTMIFKMLGVEPVSTEHFMKAPHHIIGNSMRLQKNLEIELREDWKEKMTASDKDVYKKVFKQYKRKIEKINRNLIEHIWY